MRMVPLAAIPNQAFVVTLEGVRWSIRLVDGMGVMVADLDRDSVRVLSGVRVVAGEPLIPYRYLQTGNFIFLTDGDDLPQWRQFGQSQFLVYLSAVEIASLPRISFGDFPADISYLTTDDGFYITTDDGELLTDD